MSVFTYIAQIVNFLVFVTILYFLLYKPVGRMMQQRKDAMEAALREAEEKLKEANRIRAEAEKYAEELEQKREAVIKEAREKAQEQGKEIVGHAEEQARQRIERFRRIMEQERDEMLDRIADDLRDTIGEIARAVVSDASTDLADRGIERVETLLAEMTEQEMEEAKKSLGEMDSRVQVRSAEALDKQQTDRLKKLLTDKLGLRKIQLDTEEDPSLVAGLEMTLGHVKLDAHWRAVIDEATEKHRAGA